MCCSKLLALLFLSLLSIFGESRVISRDATNLETSSKSYDHKNIVPNTDTSKSHHAPKKWAVLVAGSQGYINYRHQADVCHAYQILKNGGLKDENIIVFMYDDIAFNEDNPRPGVIINHPRGSDVYEGVPKDYIKEDANVDNLFAVILGNKTALKGGSGKVVDSGPEDSIFIYYSDHGGSGVVDMPSGRAMYATDFVHVLKKKHATKSFKSMVIYMEACEAGSMFEGLLPNNLNIYTITASNANESSYGTYCSGIPEYDGTCLGDFFSISWMEDSDKHDPEKETLEQQFKLVKRRIAYDSTDGTSHAMQYGDVKLQKQFLSVYMGRNHMNNNYSIADDGFMTSSPISHVVDQYDADLIHFKSKYARAPEGSHQKLEAQRQLLNEISCREHVQQSIAQIGKLLLDDKDGSIMRNSARPQGSPVVDDWDRFKLLVKTYEKHCGRLSGYGMKYTRAIANMCNFGVQVNEMAKASLEACHARPRNSCKTIWDN